MGTDTRVPPLICCCWVVPVFGDCFIGCIVFGCFGWIGYFATMYGVVSRVCDWAVLCGSCTLVNCNQPTNQCLLSM
eukprot:jgi/Chrzof1/9429/Cz04g02220.t1